jgi:predicted kinase
MLAVPEPCAGEKVPTSRRGTCGYGEANQPEGEGGLKPMATLHLIHGTIGTGKTTFARRLAQERGAVLFCLDRWLVGLYGSDTSVEPDRLLRVETLIAECCEAILRAGVDVVYDHGFWSRAKRDAARHLADRVGATAELYWVTCPEEVAFQRVLCRNQRLDGETFSIDPATFESLKSRVEPLGADEPHNIVETTLVWQPRTLAE